jgi:hypothetical protein
MPQIRRFVPRSTMNDNEKRAFKEMFEDLIGTKGAYILDEKLNILGKVPVSELQSTVKSLGSGIYAVIIDGPISPEFVSVAERTSVKHVIGSESKIKPQDTRINIVTADAL